MFQTKKINLNRNGLLRHQFLFRTEFVFSYILTPPQLRLYMQTLVKSHNYSYCYLNNINKLLRHIEDNLISLYKRIYLPIITITYIFNFKPFVFQTIVQYRNPIFEIFYDLYMNNNLSFIYCWVTVKLHKLEYLTKMIAKYLYHKSNNYILNIHA